MYTLFCREKSKQLAEQGAAIVALTVLGEDDGRKPSEDNPNDEITRVWKEQFQMSQPLIHKHSAGHCGKGDDSINNSEKVSKLRNGDCEKIEKNCDISCVENSGDYVLTGKDNQNTDLSAVQTQLSSER